MPLPSQQANSSFLQLSQTGDPLADQVVLGLRERGDRQRDMLTQVKELAASEGGVYQAFLDQVDRKPDWLREDLLNMGQELFLRCAPLSIASFVLGTLPLTYTPPGSAKVLLHTGRLKKDVLRRLYETATMVQAIMSPGGLQIGQAGHQAIIRVRLLHAMVRQGVLGRGNWDSSTLGQPINQLQLSLTALGFSGVIVRSLKRLGTHISQDEAIAYQHMWRYANYLQGVDISLLPENLADEEALLASYADKLIHPNDDSRVLTHSIFEGLAGQAPFHLPQGALETVARYLLGQALADALRIPRHPIWRVILGLVASAHWLTGIRYLIPGWRGMEIRGGRRYFSWLIQQGLHGSPAYQGPSEEATQKP